MLLQRASKGKLMNGETRNTMVVASLILAMTAGMRILLWLEPAPPPAAALRPLTAEGGQPVRQVLIRYAAQGDADAGDVNCYVLPDGSWDWRASGPDVNIAVVPSASAGLPATQSRALLEVLEGVQAAAGGKLQVRLHPSSDVRQHSGLPPQARELRELLVRKGKIE
jgi:hypothetical protein